MGLSATRIGEPTRRDRLLLINAFAMALLTLLGAAGESLGLDRRAVQRCAVAGVSLRRHRSGENGAGGPMAGFPDRRTSAS
jgi:hypothetical protein